MSIISAGTTSTTAFRVTSDTTGSLVLKTGASGATAIDIDAAQVVSIGNIAVTGGTVNNTIIGGTTAAAGTFTTLSAASTVTFNGGTANGVAYLNGSKNLTTGTALVFDGSNLGIGTSSPSYKLDVNTGVAGVVQRWNTGSVSMLVEADHSGNGNWYLSPQGSQTFNVKTGGSTRLTLDSSGNLGLGVTPSAWSGSAKAVQVANAAVEGRTNAASYSTLSANGYTDNGTWKYISSDFASRYTQFQGQHLWLTAASGTAGNAISFTQAMTLDASGNLGVGTTTPYAKIHATGTIKVATGNSQGILALGEGNGTTVNCGIWRGAANAPTTDGNFLNFGGYDGLVFATGAAAIGSQTERARITSGGDFGIGTTSPAGKLSVKTSSTNGSTVNNWANYAVFGTGVDSSTGAGVGVGFNSTASRGEIVCLSPTVAWWPLAIYSAGLIFSASSGNESARITSGGDLLVGTTTTYGKVSVVANSNGVNDVWIRNDSAGSSSQCGVVLNASGNSWRMGMGSTANNSNALTWNVDVSGANTERMRLTTGGDLLVGTTTAQQKLTVNGYIAGTGYNTRPGTAGPYGANVFNINWTGNPILWIDATNVGQIATTSDYRLKQNVATQNASGLARVLQLNPIKFTRKEVGIFKGSDQIEEGFLAHELQEVIPSAVFGEKDALTYEGGIQPQSLNWAPIVSVLVKAIQELSAKVAALESK